MQLTKSYSDVLQANILNLNDSTPKSFLRHMSNRNRSWNRIGNHEISGTIQEPGLKLSKKINSNRSVHREERMREVSEIFPISIYVDSVRRKRFFVVEYKNAKEKSFSSVIFPSFLTNI